MLVVLPTESLVHGHGRVLCSEVVKKFEGIRKEVNKSADPLTANPTVGESRERETIAVLAVLNPDSERKAFSRRGQLPRHDGRLTSQNSLSARKSATWTQGGRPSP